MKHTIEIDGEQRDIEIKAMDESFIVYRKMYMPPLTPKNIGTIASHDDVPQLERFRRKVWLEIIDEFFKRYYEIVSKTAFSQFSSRLPVCVVHSAQANRPKEVSHVFI
jgi:hypothetical protein